MNSSYSKKNKSNSLLALIVVTLLLSACATGKSLTTTGGRETDVTGTYTVILYGRNFSNDLETVAILAKEGGPYTFDIFAPDFKYRVGKGVEAKEALETAEKFVSYHPDFHSTRFSSIIDDKGTTIGYELRPLYYPFTYGTPDVLDINYYLKGGTVRVYIKLKEQVERQLIGDGAGEGGAENR